MNCPVPCEFWAKLSVRPALWNCTALISNKADRAVQFHRAGLADDFAEHTQGTGQFIFGDFHFYNLSY